MTDISTADRVNELLGALGEQLAARGEHHELVVVGGSALIALGAIDRSTKDVDVVALLTSEGLTKADPLPPAVIAARDRVSRDFGLPSDWLNAGPAALMDFGLPAGFLERVRTRTFSDG